MNRKKKIGSRVKKIEMLIKTWIRHLRLGASKVKNIRVTNYWATFKPKTG